MWNMILHSATETKTRGFPETTLRMYLCLCVVLAPTVTFQDLRGLLSIFRATRATFRIDMEFLVWGSHVVCLACSPAMGWVPSELVEKQRPELMWRRTDHIWL